jgi:hypothetical protein
MVHCQRCPDHLQQLLTVILLPAVLALAAPACYVPPAFSPVCTNVETLQGGRAEGYRAINRLMSALATLEQPAMAAGASLQ